MNSSKANSLSVGEAQSRRIKEDLVRLGLKEYQAAILTYAMLLGETNAARLAKAGRIPSPRVYETISELAARGFVKVRPGRPLICSPLSIEDTVGRILQFRHRSLEEEKKEAEEAAASLIEELNQIRSKFEIHPSRSPLLRIVDVGQVSEEETRRLYRRAKVEIQVFSRAYEYLPRVVDELVVAKSRNVTLKIILLDHSELAPESSSIQKEMLALLKSRIANAHVRFSSNVPLRATIIDPDDEGAAIFLAEERGVPLFVREAAVTENTGVVKGLSMLFDLLWQSHAPDASIPGPQK